MGGETTGIPFFDWMVRYLVALVPILLGLAAGGVAIVRTYRKGITEELTRAQDASHTEIETVKDDVCEAIKDAEQDTTREFAKVWAEMHRALEIQATQISEIAVLKVEQRNSWKSIEEIKVMTRDTNRKVDELVLRIAAIPGELMQALRKLP